MMLLVLLASRMRRKFGLYFSCEVVGFVDHDDLEALLGGKIDLLCLGDFFEEILDNDTVVVADI
jgi:hypothetical protein